MDYAFNTCQWTLFSDQAIYLEQGNQNQNDDQIQTAGTCAVTLSREMRSSQHSQGHGAGE